MEAPGYTLGETIKGLLRAWAASMIAAWIVTPLGISILYAFSSPDLYYNPGIVLPTSLTLSNIQQLWNLGAAQSVLNSVVVGILTVSFSFLLGLPAGYAFAKYLFRGRDALKLLLVGMRMFPIIVIAVPLLVIYFRLGLNDTLLGLALAHTAMALPFVVLISSAVFSGVPRELEEAALVFGLTPLGVFYRVTIPLALPGLSAAAMFTFLMSWNEVFIASVLTLTNRTLPAFILQSALASTDPIKFAAGFLMIVPALIFILIARRYLITAWSITIR